FEDGERLDQHVEGFHRPQFAEADDVGRVRARYDRGELGLADAVMRPPHDPGRLADLGAEQRCDVATLKQEKVRAPLQKPFERAIEPAGNRTWPVDQRAAMWRVDADRLWGAQG